jgi:hypothetical protein
MEAFSICLHISSILSADLEQRRRDLAERADFRGFHQLFENVLVADRGFLYRIELLVFLAFVGVVQVVKHLDLVLLFLFSCADDLSRDDRWRTFRAQERVDADDRKFAVVLQGFVVKAFLLDLASAGTLFPSRLKRRRVR